LGLIELIIVILVILWLLGYFGRARFYATGPSVSTTRMGGNWIHILLVLDCILVISGLLGLIYPSSGRTLHGVSMVEPERHVYLPLQ